MFCINQESNDPFFNLAVEELLLKYNKGEYLILGINRSSVIIGKHQIAHRELNTRFITENSIPVIRRISGGGTVFHDMGNLNFSFIRNSEPGKQVDFRKYTVPVIEFLSSLGIKAIFEGKNDLKINGLKISGNAEHVHRNRVLHHGTLLFNTSLDILKNSLTKDRSCYHSRAVTSNPSSVTNLIDKLPGFKDINEFKSVAMDYFRRNLSGLEIYELSEEEKTEAISLADSKYKSWEWNYAYGPEYNFMREFETAGRQIQCRLFVKEGIIRECSVKGLSRLEAAANKLVGCRHMVEDLQEVFNREEIKMDIFNFF